MYVIADIDNMVDFIINITIILSIFINIEIPKPNINNIIEFTNG